MTKLIWAEAFDRRYWSGVDHCVFYPQNGSGVAWNGVLSVNETPNDGDVTKTYFDGVMSGSHRQGESFACNIETLSYPLELEPHLGIRGHYTGQQLEPFNFSYRTISRRAEDGGEDSYFIHLVYNATAFRQESNFGTMNDSVELTKFSLDIQTVASQFGDAKGSHLMVDVANTPPAVVQKLEGLLYGTPGDPARFPSPQEVMDLFEEGSTLFITDNGDGTWTAEGPDDVINMLSSTVFSIDWPSAVYLDGGDFIVSTL